MIARLLDSLESLPEKLSTSISERVCHDNQGKSVNFIPNSIYTDYLFRDLNFEDYVYRSAIKKQILHSYAYPEKFGAWFDMNFIPISYNDGDIYYCIYI